MRGGKRTGASLLSVIATLQTLANMGCNTLRRLSTCAENAMLLACMFNEWVLAEVRVHFIREMDSCASTISMLFTNLIIPI